MPFMPIPERRLDCVGSGYAARVLREAEAICRAHLTVDLEPSVSLYLRGLLALQNGQLDFAQACFERAVTCDPTEVAYVFDLARVLEQKGQDYQARCMYRQAVSLVPESAAVQSQLARSLFRDGQLEKARQIYKLALQLEPNRASTHGELGDVELAQGRETEAFARYERAIELDPENVEGYGRLGRAHLRAGHCREAIEAFREGIRRQQDRADLHVGIGEALLLAGHLNQAVDAFFAALTIEPHNVNACRLFVNSLELAGRRGDAIDAWFRLGQALERHDCPQDAAAAYRRVLTRKPDCLRALVALASVYLQLRQPHDAIRPLEAALVLEPDHATAHQRLGWSYALSGNLERIWDEIAWIDRHGPWKRFEQPLWVDSSLQARTILLWTNAGLGDTIQFLRFIPFVKALGARVVIETRRALVPLIEQLAYVDHVVAMNAPLPDFDVHAPLAAIPRRLRTAWSRIPHDVPYVSVSPALIEMWGQRLGLSRDKAIGLVWATATSDRHVVAREPLAHHRSAPLAAFEPLVGIDSAHYVSLQFGLPAAELTAPPRGLCIHTLLNESCTIADTAALIMNLDLVITVDTMVAHLAGALGKPVWTVLPYAADWKWGLEGESTPWYPTMRLFRQTAPGDWRGVLQRVREALESDGHSVSPQAFANC